MPSAPGTTPESGIARARRDTSAAQAVPDGPGRFSLVDALTSGLVLALLLATAGSIGGCKQEPPPVIPVYDECSPGWMRVPEGPFEMGMNPDDPTGGIDCGDRFSLWPRHTVTLSEFCIQKTEVPVESFRACVQAGVCNGEYRTASDKAGCNYTPEPGERERHPMNCLTWEAARQYCQEWESGDLPSEAQWEKAARGTDLRVFPWGNDPVTCDRANYDVNGPYYEETGEGLYYGCFSRYPFTWEVGYLESGKGDSPYGLRDMAGNVAEWMIDCYWAYESCLDGTCVDPVKTECEGDYEFKKVVRGGAASAIIDNSGSPFCIFRRGSSVGTETLSTVGFRCVKPPAEASLSTNR